jgi:hypothetical protein
MPPPELLPPPEGFPEELLELPEAPPEDPLEDELAPPLLVLLEELLLEERLPDEPLDPELLGDGIEAEGIEGVDGVVGMLADGQPAMSGKDMTAAGNHFRNCLFMLKPPWSNRREMPNAQDQIPR